MRQGAALVRQLPAREQLLDLVAEDADWTGELDDHIEKLRLDLLELEQTLIPYGLHIVGEAPTREQRIDMFQGLAQSTHEVDLDKQCIAAIVDGESVDVARKHSNLDKASFDAIYDDLFANNAFLLSTDVAADCAAENPTSAGATSS